MGRMGLCALFAVIGAACRSAPSGDACARALASHARDAGAVCVATFAWTGDAATGGRAARALADAASGAPTIEMIARRIGDSPAGAEAWDAAGDARRMAGDDRGSIAAYGRALAHRDPRDLDGRIRDAIGLYNRLGHANQYREAMQYAAMAYALSRRLGDPYLRGDVLVGVGALLLELGDVPAAQELVDEADQVVDASSVFWPYLRNLHAGIDLARGRYRLAAAEFTEAAAAAASAGLTGLAEEANRDRVDAELAAGDADAAARTLAAEVPSPRASPDDRAWYAVLAAKVALARGDLEGALRHADDPGARAARDWAASLDAVRGRALVAAGRAREAEASLRAAIAGVEAQRAALQLDTLKPWQLARQREPFEDLFRLLVAQDRVGEALAIVQRATARSLLDGLFAPSAAAARPIADELDRAGDRATGLRALARSLRASPSAPLLDAPTLLARLGDRRVWTYFRAGDELWLIVAGGAAPRAIRIGQVSELRDRVAAWRAAPDRAELADALGAQLVPADALPAPGARVYVAADDPVRDVPFAALRVGGAYLIERDPIAYVPSANVLIVMADARARGRGTVVLGDPTGDLPGAREEAIAVARAMGVAPQVGGEVTRDAALAARDAALLHVAAHAGDTPLGPALRLADGWLGIADVIERGLAARVVVLTACTSADEHDGDELGALADAFVAAGATAVIASRWAVDDRVAQRFARALYAAGAAAHPIDAAAAAQRALIAAGDPVSAWSTFVAIGTEPSPEWERN